ncbi:serine/threonine-protein kinase [Nocardia australiensis]|uniref:serine/threonine-protein kinase n=1 Tax=Nocardia australiensis TaxID=2887191 RepID=UPI001D15DDA9|nr:serine/threonine-protein kinase [Nocardia australiensis]
MDGPGWRVGSRFGPYELRSLLGKGGMGEVYEAYDTVKDRVVAVKLLSEALAQDPAYQLRFRRESQAAARLAEPHIIPIHDWGVIDSVLFIDMRLVPGVDLRALLREQGPLSAERAVAIVEQIAAGLDAAHAGGLVHRDVKPANILVTDADFAYLVDFGIAHTEGDAAMTQVGMAVGSYTYMAPERFDVGPVTGRADIYSLACVLHESLTGTTPFPVASMSVLVRAHLSEPPPRPSVQRAGIPPALDEVIARGMAKDPADRHPTATDLARAARAALSAAPVANTPTFVVRAPDPATFGQTDPTVLQRQSAFIPPEATGEFVITPTDPTVVTATELYFTPLPDQLPKPSTADAQQPPVRPFPDAHLYREDQQYSGGQLYPDAQDPGAQQYSDTYTPPAPETRRYPVAQNYPAPSRNNPAPQAYSDPQQHEQTQRYAPQRYSDDGPDYRGAPSGPAFPPPPQPQHVARESRASEYSARADYSAPGEYQDDDYYGPDPYDRSSNRRSVLTPVLIGLAVVVAIAVGGVVGWQVLGSGDTTTSAAGGESGVTSTSTARPGANPGPATTAPTTSSASTSSTPAALPAGASPCSNGQSASGNYTRAATGSGVTSCQFAEAVREAYAESATANVSRSSRSVVATSPVTGRTYTMNCVAEGQVVTCSGGENAVVYVY